MRRKDSQEVAVDPTKIESITADLNAVVESHDVLFASHLGSLRIGPASFSSLLPQTGVLCRHLVANKPKLAPVMSSPWLYREGEESNPFTGSVYSDGSLFDGAHEDTSGAG